MVDVPSSHVTFLGGMYLHIWSFATSNPAPDSYVTEALEDANHVEVYLKIKQNKHENTPTPFPKNWKKQSIAEWTYKDVCIYVK